MAWRSSRPTSTRSTEPVDNLGGILSVVLVGALILAINFAAGARHGNPGDRPCDRRRRRGGRCSSLRQRRAPNPLYDLKIAGRRVFWVAAVRRDHRLRLADGRDVHRPAVPAERARLLDARRGPGDHPAALVMVIVAPRSAQARGSRGARFTLLVGYVFVLLGFSRCCCCGRGIPYWQVGLGYAFVGIGVGFAGTPASHSLTGSVPVRRAGMASGTADLQRDLGGAIMQSIFGALLTAGYAAAVADRDRRRSRTSDQITEQRPGAAHQVVRERRVDRRSSTRSTRERSPPAPRRRSSPATSGRTSRASSRS